MNIAKYNSDMHKPINLFNFPSKANKRAWTKAVGRDTISQVWQEPRCLREIRAQWQKKITTPTPK